MAFTKLEGQRETFQSPYTEYAEHIGKKFEIVDSTPASIKNHPDYKDTYEIMFEDGTRITALPEEVLNNTGWNP